MTSESEFIAALRGLPLHPGARGLEDDCAHIENLIVTHDTMAEGTHFRAEADMADVAWKLVAVNLSDLAAKGAEPVGVLLSYCLGHEDQRFLDGLTEALETFHVPLLGGDTVRTTGPRIFGMTAMGRVAHLPTPLRSGAKPGDAIYVTGMLGRAMLGFEGDPGHIEAYNRPRPLLREGRELARQANAMMDVSDGLLLDAFRMASASNRTFAIDSSSVPVAAPDRRDECLRWGDDYQLLFTIRDGLEPSVPASRIGTVLDRSEALLILDGDPITSADGLGYQH